MKRLVRKHAGLIHLKSSDVQALRNSLHKAQGEICPILKQKFDADVMALDHMHRRSKSAIGENGAGLVRGVIHRQANVLEGKIANAFKRYGLDKFISIQEFLINLAEYLSQKPTHYVHHTEAPKRWKYLQRSSHVKLVKKLSAIGYKGKIPAFTVKKIVNGKPVYGKMRYTLTLGKLFARAGIVPVFYKDK